MDQHSPQPLPNLEFHLRSLPARSCGRDLMIGDLHGELSTLWRLLDSVKFDPSIDRVIAVGDLCDHGPNSLEAVALLDQPWFSSVLGNHEVMLIARAERARASYREGQRQFASFLNTLRHECQGQGASWQLDWLEHTAQSTTRSATELALRALPLVLQLEGDGFVDTVVHAELPGDLGTAQPPDGSGQAHEFADAPVARALNGRHAARAAQHSGEPFWGQTSANRQQIATGLTICGHTPMPCAITDGAYLFIDTGNGRRDVTYPRLSAFIRQERRVVSEFQHV